MCIRDRTYAGNTSSVVVKDLSFKPDLVWVKGYTDADRHGLYDTVRGVTKRLQSAHTTAEDTQNGVTSFNDNGFSIGNYGDSNGNGRGYVAWAWKAGGSKNTFNVDDVGYATAAAAGLDGGSGTVTGASVGTKQGFSIISYTGNSTNPTTFSHGLLEAPTFVIIKNRDRSTNGDWIVGHADADGDGFASGNQLVLNTNAAVDGGSSNYFSGTAPTSSVFTVKDNYQTNYSGDDYIAYLWHDVPGLQKFGSYEGNGNVDGPYVELGFKPAVLILKNFDDTENWYIYDTVRMKNNPAFESLQASSDSAQENGSTNTRVDILSTGFKLRQSNGPNNSNSYIYMAWAEAPAFNLFGGQSNAR